MIDWRESLLEVLDFDRFIANPDALYDAAVDLLNDLQLMDRLDILAARKRTENDGGSFSVADYLLERLSEDEFSDFCQRYRFVEPERVGRYFEPAAESYLGAIADDPHRDALIMTYGDPIWQQLKIERVGLGGVPYLVVDHSIKRDIIESWLDLTGDGLRYITPTNNIKNGAELRSYYGRVLLGDDKAVAFGSRPLPKGMRGVLVRSSDGVLLPSQRGSVPAGVKIVTSLESLA